MEKILYLCRNDGFQSLAWARVFKEHKFQLDVGKWDPGFKGLTEKFDSIIFHVSGKDDIEEVSRFRAEIENKTVVLHIEKPDPQLFKYAWMSCHCSLSDARLGPEGALSVLEGAMAFDAEKVIGVFPLDSLANASFLHGTLKKDKFLKELFKLLTKPGPVTMEAEDYCGSEFLARLRHVFMGNTGPFIEIDCGFCANSLASSVVIGTGTPNTGIFDIAKEGTVFFRNAHRLTLETQAAILGWLRVNENPEVTRNKNKTNVDIIFSSDRNLQALGVEGRFNRSLAMIAGNIFIRIPPLRERKKEIPGWCSAFCANSQYMCGISPPALKALQTYSWPGNAREMKTVLEEALEKAGPDGTIRLFHLPKTFSRLGVAEEVESVYKLPRPAPKGPFPKLRSFRKRAQDQAEIAYLVKVLEESKGKLSKAMKISGLSKSTFYALLSKHGLLKLKERFEKE